MSREWKPGDVAMATDANGQACRAIFTEEHEWSCACGYDLEPANCAIRPLVVIDPEDREQVERLLSNYHGWKWEHATKQPSITDMQAALREFASPTPPKPDEPMGLGAVVEDDQGLKWTRAGSSSIAGNWLRIGSNSYVRWSEIAAFRVLSEGVSDD